MEPPPSLRLASIDSPLRPVTCRSLMVSNDTGASAAPRPGVLGGDAEGVAAGVVVGAAVCAGAGVSAGVAVGVGDAVSVGDGVGVGAAVALGVPLGVADAAGEASGGVDGTAGAGRDTNHHTAPAITTTAAATPVQRPDVDAGGAGCGAAAGVDVVRSRAALDWIVGSGVADAVPVPTATGIVPGNSVSAN